MRSTLFFLSFIFSLFYIEATAQCVSGDCKNGRGIFMYPSGAKYIGEFKDGEIHGMGTCYYTDGSKYLGNWVNRFPQGQGKKVYPNGEEWKGTWLKGKPTNGKGKIIEEIFVAKGDANDGTDIQSGCLKGDCKNGAGLFAYADGSKYEGQFQNGTIEGKGVWYYTNGDKYEGEFAGNYQHGFGKVIHADGSETKGYWKDGEYIGVNQIQFGTEGCKQGDCGDGTGTYVYENGVAKYKGEFRDGLPHGQGTCSYSNGERYEGQWSDGSFNGDGTLYLTDGSAVEGLWEYGVFQAKSIAKEKSVQTVETAKPADVTTMRQARGMKVWAVVIGISTYNHMPALRYTDDDAYRIYAFLKSPEGGALKDDQISVLIDEAATKEKIVRTMQETFSKAGPNDLVMLYFSGHGLKGSFLPIDFDGFNNKLLHDEINNILENSPAKYKICIADACHSGSLLAMKSGTAEQALTSYYKTLAQAKAGTALIMSSKADETSLESSGLRQGVFSHFLIRGLKGEADLDQNQVVTIQELYNFINENVRSYTGMRQSPVIQGDFDERMTVSVVRE